MKTQTVSTEYAARLAAVNAAGQRVAPTWPLDQLIAVNPLWEMRDQPFPAVAARLEALGRIRCLMPAEYYARLWQRSQIREIDLLAAAAEANAPEDIDALLRALNHSNKQAHWHNVSDWLDSTRDSQHKMAWRDEITHQISQFCAAFCQQQGHESHNNLYLSWVRQIRVDQGIAILMGEPGLTKAFRELPDDPQALILIALEELGFSTPAQIEAYTHALLLDINGWASWLAFERWQSHLDGGSDDALPQLIAIRLGWELALWRHWQWRHQQASQLLQQQWYGQLPQINSLIESQQQLQKPLWIWQRAAELARQREEQQILLQKPLAASPQPKLQAVFCIDVRSEVMRCAFEAQTSKIQTFGFAGFFGIPLSYTPVGTDLNRPQLPGLLAAGLRASEGGFKAQALAVSRRAQQESNAVWSDFSRGAVTSFSMVEAAGLSYVAKLLRKTFGLSAEAHPVNDMPVTGEWTLWKGEPSLTLVEKTDLVEGILKAMSIKRFASEVLLVGHGSHTTNNPHAAGLDCGACGGQTGAVNVQVLAQLLNNQGVRAALADRGWVIPTSTRFIAALHNTTTDHIQCFGQVSELGTQWLKDATVLAQRERAVGLGLADEAFFNQPEKLDAAIQRRALDWSEVRPEWGLAGNSAFIVAPRQRTRGLNFDGRAFLHDYDSKDDEGFAVLEQIMTAPMIVTHWINMQYNASVTDPLKFGSGNKVLHNVVGGNLGVFEGNGGDLRIGLSQQSLHDGQQWVHEPLRLSVYIQAPQEAIASIISQHDNVRQLVDNQWLCIFHLTDEGVSKQYTASGWQEVRNA
ncbi:MAG: DUF2309 domain-containing protein [Thalassolituus oleivorans]|uniref:DUF2309 domain-containing protein n=1 Tax=Thalassolituus oleivorans TaxID=187493 RepID=UPI001B4DA069|nr:DUF2309 domain-containing protein [Thalassolituus oleivorans]MBQ0726202.1 DUF2309 domain-containing protein [Thalassolituus oleivorans]